MRKVILGMIIAILLVAAVERPGKVSAQGTNPLNITVAGTHTSCLAPAASVTTFCFASDGLWQSLNGAAYAQIGVGVVGPAGPAGPAGATGPQGPIGPAGGVTSVNGKTGVVTIAATTTLQ